MRSLAWRAVGAFVSAVGVVVAVSACSATSTEVSPNGHHGGDSGAAGSRGQETDAAGAEAAPPPAPDALAPVDAAAPDAGGGDLVDASPDAAISDASPDAAISDARNEGATSTGDGGFIPGRTLTWNDEFDGPAGGAPNATKWRYETGGTGFGNNELQYYTNRRENSYLDGMGHLVIEARAEVFMNRSYTSARLHTSGIFSQRYGRFEARIQMPGGGKGVWPAFWVVGTSISTVGWPRCGEFDIMENRGSEPSINRGSAHGPGYSGGASFTRAFMLPAGSRFADAFHEFAIEWTATSAVWSVDGMPYSTMTPADLQARNAMWVFDGPMYILLNVAIGGDFDGSPTAATMFPTRMIVDYVRVYDVN
jgi:beta-glucanase (GH16 family)